MRFSVEPPSTCEKSILPLSSRMIFCAPFLPIPCARVNAVVSPSDTARASCSGLSADNNDNAALGPTPLTFCNRANMRLEGSVRKPYSVMASCETLNEVCTRTSWPACIAERSEEGMRTSKPTPDTSIKAIAVSTASTWPFSVPIIAILTIRTSVRYVTCLC